MAERRRLSKKLRQGAQVNDRDLQAAVSAAFARDEHLVLGTWRICVVCKERKRQHVAQRDLAPSKLKRWQQIHGMKPSEHPALQARAASSKGAVVKCTRLQPSSLANTPRPLRLASTASEIAEIDWEVAFYKVPPSPAVASTLLGASAIYDLVGFDEAEAPLGPPGCETMSYRMELNWAAADRLTHGILAINTAFGTAWRTTKRASSRAVPIMWLAGGSMKASPIHFDSFDVHHMCLAGLKIFYVASAVSTSKDGSKWGPKEGVIPGVPPPTDAQGDPHRGWRAVVLSPGDAIVIKRGVWHCVVSYPDSVGISKCTGQIS